MLSRKVLAFMLSRKAVLSDNELKTNKVLPAHKQHFKELLYIYLLPLL
jgi:hypothetical protein